MLFIKKHQQKHIEYIKIDYIITLNKREMQSLKQLALKATKNRLYNSDNIHEELDKLPADLIKESIEPPMKCYTLLLYNKPYFIRTNLDKEPLYNELLNNDVMRKIIITYLNDERFLYQFCNMCNKFTTKCECSDGITYLDKLPNDDIIKYMIKYELLFETTGIKSTDNLQIYKVETF